MVPSRLIPLAVVLSIGCARVDVFEVSPRLRPATHPDSVRFLAQEPTQPYTVIALVTVMATQRIARKYLLKEAARLGGDAILLGAGSLTRVNTGGEIAGTQLQLSGKVIVFNREGEAAN